jgi:gamma-glutamyltranspeptidase / glutathione hydrolase
MLHRIQFRWSDTYPLAPSPLVGEGRGEGSRLHSSPEANTINYCQNPSPRPSPTRGEGASGYLSFGICNSFTKLAICLAIIIGFTSVGFAQVTSTKGMVVTVSPAASEIGAKILSQGGNAVDAAIAVAFAEAVSWPEAGNIGGGGFMLVRPPDGKANFIDYREQAPRAATPTMFAKEVVYTSALTAGVPGTVHGMGLAHKRYAKLPWQKLVMPAVLLAEGGVTMTPGLAKSLNTVLAMKSTTNAEFRRVYGKPSGGVWEVGDKLLQPDLARTLRVIANNGPEAFYTGELADKLDAEMTASAGMITKQDLASYTAKERTPVTGTYRGYDILAAPPPSSGGATMIEILNILENFDVKKNPRDSVETIHLLSEAMRRAYRDRAEFLGDPDFTKLDLKMMTKEHAKKLAATIDLKTATKSDALKGNIPLEAESLQTTHFSIVDGNGMCVSNTYTLENSYGCKIVVRGAGYILNNEMTDFNHRPGITDRTGRIGTPPNLVAPGKRMLSSMCPVIVVKDGQPILVTGSPGGRTIINTVTCVVVNVLDYNMDAQAAVDAPRQHMQWFPDRISLENSPNFNDHRRKLSALGHTITQNRQGDAHTITIDPKTNTLTGAADKRLDGAAVGVK